MGPNFYCQQKCGHVDFSIEEWNKAFKYCNDAGIEGKQRDEILEGKSCNEQCFDCMAIVGQTRLKNNRGRALHPTK